MDSNWITGGCTETLRTSHVIATFNCIPIVFKNIVNAALVFAGVVAVFFIIFSGIKFITSGGDPKGVDAARKTLTFAIVGLVIILLSFFIINLIAYITRVDCIRNFGFTNCPS